MSPKRRTPDLQLIGAQQIRFHEHPERARTLRLVERLRREKVLRNPPIVTVLETQSGAQSEAQNYLLLDGANRVSAFVELKHPQIPVQVIDYGDPGVQLKGWHHLLLEGHVLDLKTAYRRLAGVELRQVRREELTHLLELRRAYAVLVDETAACWGLFPASPKRSYGLGEWIRVLEQVVAAYEGKAELERIKMPDYAHLPEVFDSMEHQLCLFPTLTKIELLELARAAILIPTGLTRHLVPGRALNLNLPLDFLTEMQTEPERVEHFGRFLERLEVEGRIRFYEEAVFILNE